MAATMSPMRQAVILQHEPLDGPGRLTEAMAARGVEVSICDLAQGARVPQDLGDGVLLVVLGGSMGVADIGSPRHGFLEEEIGLIRTRLKADQPILGICLGAQLLAHAAGARVHPNTRIGPSGPEAILEIGWKPVRFHRQGHEALFSGLADEEEMMHWHQDTFDLPSGASLIASSDLCLHQGFLLGTRQIGVQFHCEADDRMVETWLRAGGDLVPDGILPATVDAIRSAARRSRGRHRRAGVRLIGNMLDLLLRTRD